MRSPFSIYATDDIINIYAINFNFSIHSNLRVFGSLAFLLVLRFLVVGLLIILNLSGFDGEGPQLLEGMSCPRLLHLPVVIAQLDLLLVE